MQHYLQLQGTTIYSSPLADQLSVIVHLEAGKVSLKPSEWKKITPGDLILLDTCSIDPDEDKGRIQLVINGFPFFRGKIKEGNIKILEHPLYQEADTAMTNPPENHTEDEDIFDDSELDAEINSEIENSMQESEMESELESDVESEIEPESDFTESDLTSEFESGIESEIEPSEFTESDLTSEFGIKENEPSKTGQKTIAEKAPTPAKASPSAPATKLPPTKPTKTSSPTTIEEIPLNIVVEVGRLQMSIKKLLELQPGNILDLNIHPEAGVDLVLNGKRIAKGELLRIGEALGVRIIDFT
jgi:flagellar motor switch protein FliN/FliY